jgi:hypothetical protein
VEGLDCFSKRDCMLADIGMSLMEDAKAEAVKEREEL